MKIEIKVYIWKTKVVNQIGKPVCHLTNKTNLKPVVNEIQKIRIKKKDRYTPILSINITPLEGSNKHIIIY